MSSLAQRKADRKHAGHPAQHGQTLVRPVLEIGLERINGRIIADGYRDRKNGQSLEAAKRARKSIVNFARMQGAEAVIGVMGSTRHEKAKERFEVVSATCAWMTEQGISVVTGGGPGMMHAASQGARKGIEQVRARNEENQAKVYGVTLYLPSEPANPCLTPGYNYDAPYFMPRLEAFLQLFIGAVHDDGGKGTDLEGIKNLQTVSACRHFLNTAGKNGANKELCLDAPLYNVGFKHGYIPKLAFYEPRFGERLHQFREACLQSGTAQPEDFRFEFYTSETELRKFVRNCCEEWRDTLVQGGVKLNKYSRDAVAMRNSPVDGKNCPGPLAFKELVKAHNRFYAQHSRVASAARPAYRVVLSGSECLTRGTSEYSQAFELANTLTSIGIDVICSSGEGLHRAFREGAIQGLRGWVDRWGNGGIYLGPRLSLTMLYTEAPPREIIEARDNLPRGAVSVIALFDRYHQLHMHEAIGTAHIFMKGGLDTELERVHLEQYLQFNMEKIRGNNYRSIKLVNGSVENYQVLPELICVGEEHFQYVRSFVKACATPIDGVVTAREAEFASKIDCNPEAALARLFGSKGHYQKWLRQVSDAGHKPLSILRE